MTAGATDRLPDPLVDVLVRGGSLTPEAARAALDRQVMHGGALDTALLEVGVSEASILAAMTEVYEHPMAPREELDGVEDARALRALPEQWAQRHRLPPVRLTDGGRSLVVLSPAPADLELVARLSELLDLEVVPHLALEVRVVAALSRLYGTKPPARFLPLLVQTSRRAPEAPAGPRPLPFSEASAQLRSPSSRHDIARALLGFALRELAFGALWVVKDDRLEGWIGFGAGSERIAPSAVDIAPGSAVDVVLASRAHYLGPSPTDSTQDHLLRTLGRPAPKSVLMVPLRVRSRVVALFYGENGPESIPGRLAGDIMLLVSQVQSAFEQLLLRQKAESLSQLSRAPEPSEDGTIESGEPIPDVDLEIEPPMPHEASPAEATADAPSVDEDLSTGSPAPRSEAAASLPDEPMPEVEEPDEAWDPVELSAGDHGRGYEVVTPRVLVESDDPWATVEVSPSAASPPTLAPPGDMGSDGLRLVPSQLAPRPIAEGDDASDDLWATAPSITVSSRPPPLHAPEPETPEDVPPTDDPSTFATQAAEPVAWPEARADEADAAAFEIEPPLADAEDASVGFEPDPPSLEATEDLEEALWAEAGRGLAESLLDEPPGSEPSGPDASASEDEAPALRSAERAATDPGSAERAETDPGSAERAATDPGSAERAATDPGSAERAATDSGPVGPATTDDDDEWPAAVGTETDEQWDVVESNNWSGPSPALPAFEVPELGTSTSSQPVLLIERAETQPAAPEGPIPSGALESGGPEPARTPNDIEAWLQRLGEPDLEARRGAMRHLAALGPAILPAAAERFPGPLVVDPLQRRSVPPFEACGPLLELISGLGVAAHPHVARRLEAPDPRVRFYAAYFYSSVHVPEVIPRLIQRLHDEEPRICMTAARTLFGYRGHPDFSFVLEHLHGRLGATSVAARRHAAHLIGLFRDVTAIPLLIAVLERRDKNLMDVAQDALTEITKQQLGPQARKWKSWLEKNRDRSRIGWLVDGLAARDESVRRSAAEELRAVTGRDFGFEPDGPRRRREEARQQWVAWWAAEERTRR